MYICRQIERNVTNLNGNRFKWIQGNYQHPLTIKGFWLIFVRVIKTQPNSSKF